MKGIQWVSDAMGAVDEPSRDCSSLVVNSREKMMEIAKHLSAELSDLAYG